MPSLQHSSSYSAWLDPPIPEYDPPPPIIRLERRDSPVRASGNLIQSRHPRHDGLDEGKAAEIRTPDYHHHHRRHRHRHHRQVSPSLEVGFRRQTI